MHYEGPGPNVEKLRAEVEKWYNDEMHPTFMIAFNKRKDNRWPALMEWHNSVKDAIASCKKNYEDKLDEAKHELMKKEKAHPLWEQSQTLSKTLGKLSGFYRSYKRELKKTVSPEEFERIRDDIEGPYDLLKKIQDHIWDMGLALQQLKAADPKTSALGPKI